MGLQKILSLLEAEDADVRIHAVKVVANLAAEGEHLLLAHCVVSLFLIFCHIFPTLMLYYSSLNAFLLEHEMPFSLCS